MIIKRSTGVALVALLGMLGVRSGHGAGPGSAKPAPSIEVNGSGEVDVDPDRATLSIAVETSSATSAAAAAQNATVTAAVTNALLAAGAVRSDLVTANYTVEPRWQYSSNSPPKRVGYDARNTIRVSVRQLSLLGRWIDAALGAGAARVENIEFDSSNASSARRQALVQAVANAKADAEALAEAAGGKLGPLQELSTVQSTGSRPGSLQEVVVTAERRAAEQTQIEPSPLHISAVVAAKWSFEP